MRKALPLLTSCFISSIAIAQFEAGSSYSLSVPLKVMGDNIQLTHSFVADVRYHMKGCADRLWGGVQVGIGNYASKTEKQLYQFSDGSTTEVDVTFTSNIFNAHLTGGIDLLKNKSATPYIMGKAGISNFFSKIYIPDPDDDDGCRPLKNKNVYKDLTWSAGGGAGIKINANSIFKSTSDNWWFDLSLNYLAGGSINYLNVKHIQHHTATPDPSVKSFNVQFVNIITNETHDHQVAEVFSSRVDLLDIKLGVFIKLY